MKNICALLDPGLAKACPTSEAVNNALAGRRSIASVAGKRTKNPSPPGKTQRAPKKRTTA
jgi:hypothetical protein